MVAAALFSVVVDSRGTGALTRRGHGRSKVAAVKASRTRDTISITRAPILRSRRWMVANSAVASACALRMATMRPAPRPLVLRAGIADDLPDPDRDRATRTGGVLLVSRVSNSAHNSTAQPPARGVAALAKTPGLSGGRRRASDHPNGRLMHRICDAGH